MRDAHCAHCGYDLIGLARESDCPECGRPYDKATRRNVSDSEQAAPGQSHTRRNVAVAGVVLALVCVGTGGALALGSQDPLRWVAVGLTTALVCLLVGLYPLTR